MESKCFFVVAQLNSRWLHPLRLNMEPENDGLEDVFFSKEYFQVLC